MAVSGTGSSGFRNFSLGGSIQKAGEVVFRTADSAVNKVKTSSMGQDKAVRVKFLPLLPLILTVSALLYHEGMQEGRTGKKRGADSKRILAESGLATLMSLNTSGLMPLLGIGLVAYNAGNKDCLMEKVQLAVNYATAMVLGYTGVHLASGLNESAYAMDEKQIQKALARVTKKSGAAVTLPAEIEGAVDNWLNGLSGLTNQQKDELRTEIQKATAWLNQLPELTAPEREALGKTILSYHQVLRDKRLMKSSGESWKLIRQKSADLSRLKEQLFNQLPKLDGKAIRQAATDFEEKAYEGLYRTVEDSQRMHIRLARFLNPVFGYTLMGLMVGVPVAASINRWLARRFPQMKNQKVNDVFSSKVSMMPNIHAAPGSAPSVQGGTFKSYGGSAPGGLSAGQIPGQPVWDGSKLTIA